MGQLPQLPDKHQHLCCALLYSPPTIKPSCCNAMDIYGLLGKPHKFYITMQSVSTTRILARRSVYIRGAIRARQIDCAHIKWIVCVERRRSHQNNVASAARNACFLFTRTILSSVHILDDIVVMNTARSSHMCAACARCLYELMNRLRKMAVIWHAELPRSFGEIMYQAFVYSSVCASAPSV